MAWFINMINVLSALSGQSTVMFKLSWYMSIQQRVFVPRLNIGVEWNISIYDIITNSEINVFLHNYIKYFGFFSTICKNGTEGYILTYGVNCLMVGCQVISDYVKMKDWLRWSTWFKLYIYIGAISTNIICNFYLCLLYNFFLFNLFCSINV